MKILDKIAAYKRREVLGLQNLISLSIIENSPYFQRDCHSLRASIKNSDTGIIAEFKRRSPSKKELNPFAQANQIVPGYQTAGAAGISVLTDDEFFGGSSSDLQTARQLVELPILRKDFIINEFQILEAKGLGADVILLIAALLSPKEIKQFAQTSKSLGLEVLLEVHNEEELQKNLIPEVDLIGVNNRNLKTFEVNLNTSRELAEKIPSDFIKISESGISEVSSILDLQNYGYQGFLMGENFMKTSDPGQAAMDFINALKK